MQELYNKIARLGRKYGATRIILFGSRARGDHRENSDIDLAVYGMPENNKGLFWSDIDELQTILDFDIVHITENTNSALLQNIEKDGVILMDKFTEKYEKLCNAYERLKEATDYFEQMEKPLIETQSQILKDGIIQRFEFCAELAWKTIRERLIVEGVEGFNTPKSVMRQAYAAGFLADGDMWIKLIDERNRTSHMYDEKTSEEIFSNIRLHYIKMFEDLIERLR